MTKVYLTLWAMLAFAAGIFVISGTFTHLVAVILGFACMPLIFAGIIIILPGQCLHAPRKREDSSTKPMLKARSQEPTAPKPGRRTPQSINFVASIALAIFSAAVAIAQTPQFNVLKPSTTGVPGDEVRVMAFDPSGNLWIAARQTFWQEWAVAMLPASETEYHPLPGGGFDTGAWKVWSTVHGNPLPSQYMYDMEFSSDGTMWLASEGGLTRFRPNASNSADRWFTYTSGNSPLVMNEIRSIAIDSQDNLWISNARNNFAFSQLFKLNTVTSQWTSISTGQQPWEVAIGNNDHVLVSMINVGGIMEFDGGSWAHHPTDPREMGSMVQDALGNIWAVPGVNGDGLWKWNGSSWQNWPQIGGTITVTGIGKDRDGVVYVSTWYGGIYKMINATPVFFAAADNIPRSVIGRPSGDIWINNYGGNGTLGTVRHYTATGQLLSRMNTFNAGLPDYFVDRIKRDTAGNMWFATGEGGLTRMLGSDGAPGTSTHWRNWGNHNDQSEPYPWAGSEPMYSLFEDADGIFWMAGNGVGRWNSATGQFTHFWNAQNSNLDSSGMKAIIKRGDTMWVGTGGSGVSWLNGSDWTRVWLSPTNYEINHVNALAVDTANNLWVASNYGLRKFAAGDNLNFTEYGTYNSPLPSDYILDLMADPSGGIWIGTTVGLVRFDGTTWTIYNQANTGMPGTSVQGIARRASDGLIAIANNQGSVWPYTGGVSTFDGTTWTHYTPDNSPLTHWQNVAVEFDVNGNLWASPISTGVVQIMLGRAPGSIAGTVTYGNSIGNPTIRSVSNVTVSATGSPNVNAITASNGSYSLTGFGAGSYTVTPTKTGDINGITAFDAAKIAQHAAGTATLTNSQLIVADVSGNGTPSSFDAAQVARFAAGLSNFGSTGNWIFSPTNRSYSSVTTNISNEDYSALLMGEVSGNWNNTGVRTINSRRFREDQRENLIADSRNANGVNSRERDIAVSLPRFATAADKEIVFPVSIDGAARGEIISYEFDLRFDPSVIQPLPEPVDVAGTASRKLSYVINADKPGLLRVIFYGSTPLDDGGILLNLRFTAVGKSGSISGLSFDGMVLNEGKPLVRAADGQIALL